MVETGSENNYLIAKDIVDGYQEQFCITDYQEEKTQTGDRGQLTLMGEDKAAWNITTWSFTTKQRTTWDRSCIGKNILIQKPKHSKKLLVLFV